MSFYNPEHVILAAREDAKRIERRQRQRQLHGEHYSFATHYAYAVLDHANFLHGFIHGHLTVRRMNAFRRRAKVPQGTVLIFRQLLLIGGHTS